MAAVHDIPSPVRLSGAVLGLLSLLIISILPL
jgi:hypothetical protein